MRSSLNQQIEIIPGDEDLIETSYRDNTVLPSVPKTLTGFTWNFAVFANANDPDTASIFSVTTPEGDPTQGQANFRVKKTMSTLLSRGVTYYFRIRWTDTSGAPYTAFAGTVSTS